MPFIFFQITRFPQIKTKAPDLPSDKSDADTGDDSRILKSEHNLGSQITGIDFLMAHRDRVAGERTV